MTININNMFDVKYYQKGYGEEKDKLGYNLNIGLVLVIIIVINILLNKSVLFDESYFLNMFLFLIVLKFSSSKGLLGGGKELLKYFPGILVCKKNVMRKNISCKKEKSKQDIVHVDDNFHKTNVLISQYTEDVKKHPVVMGVVHGKSDISLVTGNLTTSPKNSTLLVKENVFHKKPVLVYNEVVVEKINSDNISDVQEIVEKCKDVVFTEILASNKASRDLNEFMVNKASEQIGEKQETYMPGVTFEQKTKKLVDLFEDFKQMNSRED